MMPSGSLQFSFKRFAISIGLSAVVVLPSRVYFMSFGLVDDFDTVLKTDQNLSGLDSINLGRA
jgi:hypothetical protein